MFLFSENALLTRGVSMAISCLLGPSGAVGCGGATSSLISAVAVDALLEEAVTHIYQPLYLAVEEAIERPLPKPSSADYASARLLEALVEAKLAIDFLKRGLTRNAAGKAFQAWRAVLATLLKLELERLKALAKTGEERRWLEEKAVPRVPTSRMMSLSRLLEELGYVHLTYVTDRALNLHDYQYHGPDPDMALSKYRTREEAAYFIKSLIEVVAEYAERLKTRVTWTEEHERVYRALVEEVGGLR